MSDLVEWVAPGFAGFAVTRFITRVAAQEIEKRKPEWGKHAGAVTSIGAFLASWYLGQKVKWLAKYHTPITVGSAIAAATNLIQLYFPKIGWMVGDPTPELVAADAGALTASSPGMPELHATNEDPNEYTYNDSFDAGRYGVNRVQHGGGGDATPDMSDLEVDDAIGQSANLGVFSQN